MRTPERPNEPGGLVVRDHSAAAPPVARITARDRRACGHRPCRAPVDAVAGEAGEPVARRLSRTVVFGVLGDERR